MKKHQQGFAVIETLLVLVILGLVAGTGYYVWHSKQNTDDALKVATQSVATTPAKSAVTKQKYLTVSDWGVKVPLTSDISDAYYLSKASLSGAVFLSKATYKGTDCAADNVSLGVIMRFTVSDRDEEGNTYLSDYPQAVKVGSFYYVYQPPQAACSGALTNDNSSFDQSQVAKVDAFKAEFKAAVAGIVAAQ